MKGAVALALLLSAPVLAASGAYRRRIAAPDGTQLALYRFVPAGGGLSRPPVLLVPELGFNRAAYDLDGGGLARYLQAEGHDVFVVEPRGHGASDAPKQWALCDVGTQDVGAALAAIAALREGPVDLIVNGFSGGVVLGAVPSELKGRVRRVVALAPVVAPDPPTAAMRSLLALNGAWSRMAFSPSGASLFDLLFARNGRLSSRTISRVRVGGMSGLPASVSSELTQWMESGELRYPDGSALSARLAELKRPTLLVLALGDNFAQPEFGSPLRDLTPAPVVLRMLSRREAMGEDYSHLSLLHGQTAAADVFRPVARFLAGQDPNAPAPAAEVKP